MTAPRVDAFARTLSATRTRRALSSLLAMVFSLLAGGPAFFPKVAAKKNRRKKARTEGPCGDGSGKANRCRNHRQCCTGYCDRRKTKRRNGRRRKVRGRCRCRKEGQACSDDRNCCLERTGRICKEGTCQVPLCAEPCPHGCCAGGSCAEGDSDAACGRGGALCRACAANEQCEAGACVLLPCAEWCGGCCQGETCDEDGNTDAACGTDGETCQVCGTDEVCTVAGCACGDVCASGCPYSSIQDAIDDPEGPATIRLCADTYPETVTITRNLTLLGKGDGADGSILDGQQAGTVAHVQASRTVGLQALRITGGANSGEGGGGILSAGNLTLTDCTVTGNTADGVGGGIYNNDGTLTMTRCAVTENTANDGGGIYNDFNDTITLTDCTVSGNTATDGHGGGIDNREGGTVNLNNTSVTLNEASTSGGGINNHSTGTVNFQGTSCVEDNQGGNCAGTPTCPGCTP